MGEMIFWYYLQLNKRKIDVFPQLIIKLKTESRETIAVYKNRSRVGKVNKENVEDSALRRGNC